MTLALTLTSAFMLLAIDIGNTSITIGVFKKRHLIKRYLIPTKQQSYFVALHRICAHHAISDAIICSVVPKAAKKAVRDLSDILGRRPYIIGKDIKAPIKNRYRKPQQVGTDRLVNAYAGVMFYGTPLIVIDFGTAVTFDVVSKKGEYLGGMILPGLQISLDALAQRTALLPQIRLAHPKGFIGRDTRTSMLSGVVFGFAALVDALALRVKKVIGKNAQVVGTGGDSPLLARYSRQMRKYDRELTLKGIVLLYEQKVRHV